MTSIASFHIYIDGIDAALDWLASAELFLHTFNDWQLYNETLHLLYHLYNYEQLCVLLSQETPRVLEALQEIKEALVIDEDCETA